MLADIAEDLGDPQTTKSTDFLELLVGIEEPPILPVLQIVQPIVAPEGQIEAFQKNRVHTPIMMLHCPSSEK